MNPVNSATSQERFEVTTYDSKSISTKTLTQEELGAIDLQSYDFALAPLIGAIGFRDQDGTWIPIGRFKNCKLIVQKGARVGKRVRTELKGKGLGKKGLELLQTLQFVTPRFVSVKEIADSPSLRKYLQNIEALHARIAAIRLCLGDSAREGRYIATCPGHPLAYGWNAERSWIWIEPIAVNGIATNFQGSSEAA